MTKIFALTVSIYTIAIVTHGGALAKSLYVGENPEALETVPTLNSIEELQALNLQLVKITPKIQAATVCIIPKGGKSSGSGVVIAKNGLILTAAHVIDRSNKGVYVIFPDGKIKSGTVLGADYDRDAAMIQIKETGSYPFVEMGDSTNLKQNQWVLATGNSGGFQSNRKAPLRFGRILLKDSFLVTDAVVVGGDSGGPLFDTQGKVIGIHSHIGISLGENHHVPIEVFHRHWNALKKGESWGKHFKEPTMNQPSLGLKLGQGKSGAQLLEVVPGSPTEQAGLKKNDLIISVNNKKIRSPEQFIKVLRIAKDGSVLRIWYQRNGEKSACRLQLPKDINTAEKGQSESDQSKATEINGRNTKNAKSADQLLRISAKGHGYIEMTAELYKHFGGIDQIREYLAKKRAENYKRLKLFSNSYLKLLQPLADKKVTQVAAVSVKGIPVALGTVISPKGHILTSLIDSNNDSITARLKGKVYKASLLSQFPKHNLTLLKLDSIITHPIHLHLSDPPLGALVTSPDKDGTPIGMGIVSVSRRSTTEVIPLGMNLEDHQKGARISKISKGGPAQKAGLELNDVITHFAGKPITSSLQLRFLIQSLQENEKIEVVYHRAEQEKQLSLKLEFLKPIGSPQQMPTSGKLSKKTSGFVAVIQHDLSIPPELCGGPLFDIEGRFIGVNVSRAGRTKTYAVPAQEIKSIIENL